MSFTALRRFGVVGWFAAALAAGESVPVPSTTIDALVARAHQRHPNAAAAVAASAAAAGRVASAGAWDNPELEVSLGRTRPKTDDLATDHPMEVRVTQRLPWPGVRSARIAAARAGLAVAAAEAAVLRLELAAQVRSSAITWAVSQVAIAQAVAAAGLAADIRQTAERAAAAGVLDQAAVVRAKLESVMAETQLAAARRSAATAWDRLRLWCGADLTPDVGVASILPELPKALGEAITLAPDDPRTAVGRADVIAADRAIDAARLSSLPIFALGASAEREADRDTFRVFVGLDLPLWNRNAGGLAEAKAERQRAAAQVERVALDLRQAIQEAAGAYAAAQAEAIALHDTALPLAEAVVGLRQSAFAAGTHSLTDVLEARRAALATQGAYLDARRRAAEALVALGLARGGWEGLP